MYVRVCIFYSYPFCSITGNVWYEFRSCSTATSAVHAADLHWIPATTPAISTAGGWVTSMATAGVVTLLYARTVLVLAELSTCTLLVTRSESYVSAVIHLLTLAPWGQE